MGCHPTSDNSDEGVVVDELVKRLGCNAVPDVEKVRVNMPYNIIYLPSIQYSCVSVRVVYTWPVRTTSSLLGA